MLLKSEIKLLSRESLEDIVNIFRRTQCYIGEALVGESKCHINSKDVCEKIREYLGDCDIELDKVVDSEFKGCEVDE